MELLTRSKIVDSLTERHALPEGLTVTDMMVAVRWDRALLDYTVVVINGRVVPRDVWDTYCPPEGKEVFFMLRPAGGGGGGGGASRKSLIAAVASIAVMVVATIVAPYLAPLFVATTSAYFGAVTAAITATIAIAGSLAIGALIKPPKMSNAALTQNAAGGGGSPAEGSIYSVTGSSNSMSPYGIVPKIFGRARVAPNLAAEPVIISAGPAQILRLLLDFGYGPLQIEDVRIGSTPITSFPTARYIIHPYYKKGDALGIYTNDQSSLSVGSALVENIDNVRRMTQPGNAVYLEFGFPGGLGQFTTSGESLSRSEHITVFVRDPNGGDWVSIGDYPHWAFFASEHVSGVSTSGEQQVASFVVAWADKAERRILLPYGSYVPTVGQWVRWNGEQYLVTGVDTTTAPPAWQGGNFYVYLNELPPTIAWGNAFINGQYDQNVSLLPLESVPYPTLWELNITAALGPLTVGFGPSIYDVQFTGKTRVARVVTVAMTLPYYGTWDVLVRRSTPVSADTLVANQITWTTLRSEAWRQPIAPNVPRTIMEVEVVASDEINGQVQNINALVTSIVYDPALTTQAPSRNPALMYMDLLTSGANKKKVDLSRMDMVRLNAWRAWCDAASPQGDVNATCDLVVDYRTTVAEVAQTICAAGRAAPTVVEGLYSVITEEEDRVPVQMFTSRNAKEFSANRVWVEEPQAVKVRYVSEVNWERSELIAFADGQDENNTTKYDTLDLVGTSRPWQAWRMGRYYLAASRLRKEKMTLNTDVENLVCQRGDLVLVGHDQLLQSAIARARVISGGLITFDADFESAFYSEALPENKANTGTPTGFPTLWATGGTVNAAVAVSVLGKGIDSRGREFADYRINKAAAGGSTNWVQVFTGSNAKPGAYFDINSDDDLVTEQEVQVLSRINFIGSSIDLVFQPHNSTAGSGLGSPAVTNPFPEDGVLAVLTGTTKMGNILGVVNIFRPNITFRWDATIDHPATLDIRIFTPRHYINNRKPDLLQRAEPTNLLPNAAGVGARVGMGVGDCSNVLPTDWLLTNWMPAGASLEITRVDDVWSYHEFDMRVRIPDANGGFVMRFNRGTTEGIPIPASRNVAGSMQTRLVGGTAANHTFRIYLGPMSSEFGWIAGGISGAGIVASTTQETRHSVSGQFAQSVIDAGGITYRFGLEVLNVNGPVDVTYRIRLPLSGETDPAANLPAVVEPDPVYAQFRTQGGVILDPTQILAAPSSDQFMFPQDVVEQIEPGDLAMFGKVDQIVTEWLVEGITPGTSLSAQLTLIEYAPELRDVDAGPIPPYVPPNSETGFITEFGAVRNLDVLVSDTYEDTFSVNAVRVAWLNPGYAVKHYILERVIGEGNRVYLGAIADTSFVESIPTEGLPAGGTIVEYFVTPITARGLRGAPASATGTVFPDTVAPDAPAITSNVMGTMTRLLWSLPKAPDVDHFEIRWSPDYTTTEWNRMQILSRTVSGRANTVSVHTRSGLYAIRAVDRANNYSPVAYTRTIVDVAPAVDTSYTIEGPAWAGTFVNCVLNGDGHIQLLTDPRTGRYFSDGFFYFSNEFIATRVWGMRAESSIVMSSFPDNSVEATNHDAQVILRTTKTLPFLNSAWFTPLATAVPLAGDPTNRSEWTPIVAEWVDAKIVEGGVWLRSFDGINTPVVEAATLDLFFDPRSESKNDVPAAGGLLTVLYRYPFFQTPGLQITLNNGDRDDFIVRTASSNTGFSMEIRSGNGQLVTGRNVDWTAVGIGIGL